MAQLTKRQLSQKRYNASAKGRAVHKRYNSTAKARAAHSRHNASTKGKASHIRYNATAKGRALQKRQNERVASRERRARWRQSLRGKQYMASDAVKAIQKRWRATPIGKESRRAAFNKWRAAAHDGGSYTHKEWLALISQFGHCCVRCGKSEKQLKRLGRVLSADHVVPLAWRGPELRGQRGLISNIQPLCFGLGGCNNTKHCTIADYR
jgi:hypothetical protein